MKRLTALAITCTVWLVALTFFMALTSCTAEPAPEPKPVSLTFFEKTDSLTTQHFSRVAGYMLELNALTDGDLFDAMRPVLDSMKVKHPDELYHLKYKYRLYPEF